MLKPNIVDIITSEGVILRQHGRIYTAFCPFSEEKTPSFTVYPEKQRFVCFGACQKKGDVIAFIQELKHYSFREALGYLRIKGDSPGGQKERETKRDLLARYKKWERERFLSLIREYKDLIWEIENVKLDWELEIKYKHYHRLPVVEWQLDVLIEGSSKDKFELFKGES